MTGIMAILAFILQYFFLSETYAPIILCYKAFKIRLETKNMTFYAAHELEAFAFNYMLDRNLNRPLRLLVGEPIVFLTSLYMSFV
jgi:MFS transporter, DHA1 family, multidrug resistance protein